MAVAIILMLLVFPGVSLATVSYSADEIEIVRLINEYRVANGLSPVLVSDVLSDAAEKHSHDMAKYAFWGHVTVASDWFPAGSIPSQRMVACGYPANHWTGENISGGYDTPPSMMTAWKQSQSHNSNMLDPRWTVVGIGLVTLYGSPYQTYCTTDFGSFVDGTAHENGGTLPPDTTPPVVTFLQPDIASEARGTVYVTVDVTDNRGVAHVDLYANGGAVATDTASPYVFAWDSRTVPNGTCTLEVRAFDPSGNMGVATRQVEVTGSSATSSSTTTTSTTTTTTSTTSTTTTSTTATVSTTSTTNATTSTTAPPVTHFSDVPAGHPYYSPIMALAGIGVLSGFDDGTFRPNAVVTRAQFTKIIVLALGVHSDVIDGASHPTFSDVPYRGVAYPFDFVEEAAALHIITGYSDGTFGPAKKITRLQLALMLVRAGGDDLSPTPSGYVCPFTDVPVSSRDEVASAVSNGIVSGKSAHTFDPYSSATRGQVAKMVYSLCKILQKVQ